MRSLMAGLEWVASRFTAWQMPPKAVIFKVRTRLGYPVMAQPLDEVAHPLGRDPEPGFLPGLRLAAVDGAVLEVPR
ncbi:hypothetical protein GCM10023166_17610 [Paeniglutamicibacter cryotolerans]